MVIRLFGKRNATKHKVKLKSVITEYLNPPEAEIIIDNTLPAGTTEVPESLFKDWGHSL